MIDPTLRPDEIFDKVADLSPQDRTSPLDSLCGQDSRLRREVDSLLAAWDECGDFLDQPVDVGTAGIGSAPPAMKDLSGQTIGSWLLKEPLGSGGMGDVWLATRQVEGAEQTVALKIIRTAILAPDTLMRFRNECRVLARLEHPGIARLVEGAVTPDGVPYLVVEYIEGMPIDQWCEERELTVRQRVELLAAVCEAVRHLNRHSVIHRDIKSANVLVGTDGRPRLIDFGIARILDATEEDIELTVTGLERMTPTYASPEQLRGDPLSIASDVYSLGVLAFKLLTGGLPRTGRNRWELEKEITTSGAPRPSEANIPGTLPVGALRGDLDTIVQTALHPELDRRYPSAEALREDLARYLDGRPVLARGDSFLYVAGKFVQRHLVAVIFAVTALLLLVGGVISGFTLYGRAETARREAEKQQQTAEQVSDFLERLLAAVNPVTSGAKLEVTVREALDAAADRVDRELDDQPAVAASLHATMGSAYLNLGLLQEAEEHLISAYSLYGSPDVQDFEGQAEVRVHRGKIAHDQDRLEEAEELLTGALSSNDLATRARANLYLSDLFTDQSRLDEAVVAALRARRLAEKSAGSDPMLPAQAISQMGVILYRQGNYAAAETTMAAAVVRAQADLGTFHVLTGECTQNLGVILTALNRLAEASLAFKEALEIYERVYPADHPEFAVTLLGLGDAEAALGRHEEALEDYKQAKAILERIPGSSRINWSLAANGEAHCLWRLGHLAEADSLFSVAVETIGEQLGPSHPWTAATRNNLAYVKLESGHRTEAASMANRVLENLEKAFPDGHAYVARPLGLLAEIDMLEGRYEVAGERIDTADSLTLSLPPISSNRTAVGLHRARLFQLQGQTAASNAILDSLQSLADMSGDQGVYLTKKLANLNSEAGAGQNSE